MLPVYGALSAALIMFALAMAFNTAPGPRSRLQALTAGMGAASLVFLICAMADGRF